MAENKSWNDSLDEMLTKLNNGDYIDQSVNEFKRGVDDTVIGVRKTVGKNGNTTYTTNSNVYKVVVPHINRTIENTKYPSRYQQVLTCLENIQYDQYPDDKKQGYQSCINKYIDDVKNHQNSFKALDLQIDRDMREYKSKVKTSNVDAYLQGYYDALLMIKKVLNNSKLARLQELANKVGV